MSFTHLQVRSGYSLLSSTIKVENLVKQASELGFQSLSLTDEGVLSGVISFYKACLAHQIKPIIGMTVSIGSNEMTQSLILIAKNNAGYEQLVKLSTYMQQHQITQLNTESLKEIELGHIIGIMPITNSIGKTFVDGESFESIENFISQWMTLFKKEDFYLGIENHGSAHEQAIVKAMKSFSASYDVQVVGLNDVRYLNREDDEAFDCLQSLKEGKQWDIKQRNELIKNKYLRSSDEMESTFSDWPELIENTQVIASRCQVTFELNKPSIPSYPVPVAKHPNEYLQEICYQNVKTRYNEVTKEIYDRLAYELKIIADRAFSNYFLIVWDFVQFAKRNNILVGPGRGSAAGSLVSYVLGITEIDPMKYGLVFERFLNPERQSMPDIDIDFSDYQREEVIEYIFNKYGSNHVAQIVTFGTFGKQSVINELIKTISIDQDDATFILNSIANLKGKTLGERLKHSTELKAYVKQSKKLTKFFKIAITLEGLPRYASTHAAGIVISERPLTEHIPLMTGSRGHNITQFAMDELELLGLLKIDLLGLRNLSFIERLLKSIYRNLNKSIQLKGISPHDEKTFSLLQGGYTNGIFQLESQGMKNVLQQLKPTTFEDIVAVNALYRPGPMKYISNYIDRKHQREKVHYIHPDLQPILSATYGVVIYQEQIMQVLNRIAGYSYGQADVIRRLLSANKNIEKIKSDFIKRSINNGYESSIASQIFKLIIESSNYGFNKSHAVAYSKIAYDLAYLKAHYPVYFFTELLNATLHQKNKAFKYIQEARSLGIKLLPPSINNSFSGYTVENNQIRIGLLAIKGVGKQTVNELIKVRKESGAFKNIFDFCLKTPQKLINRTVIEHLIMAGAFDETFNNRASLLASIDKAIEQGELFREFSDQTSLLQETIALDESYIKMDDFSQLKKLRDEKELLGLYMTNHPLQTYRKQLRQLGFISLEQSKKLLGKRNLKSTAILESIRKIRTKRGDSMAFVVLNDENTSIDGVIFPDLYRTVNKWLQEDTMITIYGKVEERNNDLQWIIDKMKPLSKEMFQVKTNDKKVFIKISDQKESHALTFLRKIAEKYPGDVPVIIYHKNRKKAYKLSVAYNLEANYACMKEMNEFFDRKNVVLQSN